MLLDQLRVFKKVGVAALADISLANQNDSKSLVLPIDENDYVYVAQRFPFAHLFFEIGVANDVAASMSVEIWSGDEWVAAVDVMDGTMSDDGKTLAQSGQLLWNVPRDEDWQVVGDTQDDNAPDELSTIHVFDMYWARLKVSDAIKATTAVKEIGYALTHSQELKKFDSDIDNFFDSFFVGKTDWIPEIRSASKVVVTKLKSMGLIVQPGQIIELDDVYLPVTYKALALIYFHLGRDYEEKRKQMERDFEKALTIRRFTFDTNKTGKVETQEIANRPVVRVR